MLTDSTVAAVDHSYLWSGRAVDSDGNKGSAYAAARLPSRLWVARKMPAGIESRYSTSAHLSNSPATSALHSPYRRWLL